MKRLLFTVFLVLAASLSLQAQKHNKKPAAQISEPEITIVDDESCGCELYYYDGIQTIRQDSLFGFKLVDGTELVAPKYKFVGQWKGDYCIVYADYEKCGLINREGREIVPCLYQEVTIPVDGMIRVMQNDLLGYYTTEGTLAIPPKYRASSTFNEGLAVVCIDIDSFFFAYGYINKQDSLVIPAKFQYAYPFFNGYAVVKQYDRYGLIDPSGREAFTCKYEALSSVDSNHIFAVLEPDAEGEKWALFSTRNMKPITDYEYDGFIGYGDGYYVFQKDNEYGFLNTKGRKRFGRFEMAQPHHKGHATVVRKGHYGIINKRGRAVLPYKYDNSQTCPDNYNYYDGLAVVEKDGLFGFADYNGKIVIPIQYENCFHFNNGLAPVKLHGLWGYIDQEGNTLVPFLFQAASPFEYGRAEVIYNSNASKINTKGKCVKDCSTFPKW